MFENFKKYKTLYNKRFIIFEIENFLSEENYKNIYDNFPKLNNNELTLYLQEKENFQLTN